jgi:isopenicillin-N epimerase
MTSPRFGRHRLPEWPLDPDVTYLNHGTVGVTPRRVLAAQQEIRETIERQPSRFLLRELSSVIVGEPRGLTPRLRAAAAEVAAFVGARGDDLVFVDNATTGANAVLRSFPFEAGDELLAGDLSYGGVLRAAMFTARERGVRLQTVSTPYPVRSGAELVDAYLAAVTPRTRLAIVDHITSESALVMPLAEIAAALRARGVAVLADGAHAPGSIPLDVPALGVDWYAANLHKWAWTPRNSGFLWAPPERQHGLHPAVISWGLDQGFTAEFDMPGTRDPSAHLAAPAALALMREEGVDAVRGYNHSLAWTGAQLLAERWRTTFTTPESMIGTMATVMLPESCGTTREEAARLRDALLYEDRIEVQVHAFRDRLHVRISAQIYNDLSDVERLAKAIWNHASGGVTTKATKRLQ